MRKLRLTALGHDDHLVRRRPAPSAARVQAAVERAVDSYSGCLRRAAGATQLLGLEPQLLRRRRDDRLRLPVEK